MVDVRVVSSEADLVELRLLVRAYAVQWTTASAGRRQLDELMAMNLPAGHTSFVARVAGRPVGCVLVGDPVDGVAEVRKLYTVPGARNLGVGMALLSAAITHAMDHRLNLGLGVEEDRVGAQRLYERHGFMPTGSDRYPGYIQYLWAHVDVDLATSAAAVDEARALIAQYVDSWYGPGEAWSQADTRLVLSLPAGHTCFVARVSGSPVGAVLVRDPVDGCAEVRKLFVVPAARGRGVGAALMGAVLKWATAHQLTLVGDVEAARGPARRLYGRLGFEESASHAPGFRALRWTSR